MRITEIRADNIPPIQQFHISDMGSVVIVAGANGAGKTRLKEAIIKTFRSPKTPQLGLGIAATRPEEATAWEQEALVVEAGTGLPKLTEYMNTRHGGGTYVGSVIQVDSDRTVQPVKFAAISWATPDPDDADINYKYYLNTFSSRWNDLVNKIYQKSAARDRNIARFVKDNPDRTGSDALSSHPDSFLLYQQVFSKLLPAKRLEPIDPTQPREFHYTLGDS